MNRSTLLDDFFILSEIANDDLMIVSELIQFHQSGNDKLSRIKSDLTNWRDQNRLERYANTINNILSLPHIYVKTFIQVKRDKIN